MTIEKDSLVERVVDEKVTLLHNEYAACNKMIDDAVKRMKEVQTSLQDQCEHRLVVEVDYQGEGVISYAQPPCRMCEVCGLEEDGWGSGYDNLFDKPDRRVRNIGSNRDTFYGFRDPQRILTL